MANGRSILDLEEIYFKIPEFHGKRELLKKHSSSEGERLETEDGMC